MSSERQENNQISPWWGEHVHRYQYAINLIEGKEKILDIACGSGFGTNMLAQSTTGDVFGCDISKETITANQKSFNNSNLIFNNADGTQLPFENNYFDLIISYETIEHTTEYLKILTEFKRCIKPTGTIYISTPNIEINSPDGKIRNPYHTQEFNFDQLEEILKSEFLNFKIGGQKYTRYKNKKKPVAKFIEKLLYIRGIRKIPVSIQNKIMNLFGINQHYPLPTDFEIVFDRKEVIKCKTFFVIIYAE